MIKVESIYATTLIELVQNMNSWIVQLEKDIPGFEVVSISHSNPSETHPKYSALIAYKIRP